MSHKLAIHNADNQKTGDVTLPGLFDEPFRPDLISRAVLSIEANGRQPYGAYPEAGRNSSSKLSRRRRDWKASYGHGISRVPRKIMSRNGTRMNWVGALAPGTVKGRRAHPPKMSKIWALDVSTHERKKATKSALAATLNVSIVKARGHHVPASFPFIIEDAFESLTTTKSVVLALEKLGFAEELQRTASSTRAGRGKMRGRAKIVPRSVLFVINSPSSIVKAARNIPGIEVVLARNVNAKHLAPGCHPGRLTLYTKSAIAALETRFAEHAAVRPEQKSTEKAPAPAKKTSPSSSRGNATVKKKAAA